MWRGKPRTAVADAQSAPRDCELALSGVHSVRQTRRHAGTHAMESRLPPPPALTDAVSALTF